MMHRPSTGETAMLFPAGRTAARTVTAV